MKTAFDIVALLYDIIDVESVTTKIDGNVYQFKKPLNSQKQDIVILSLPIDDGDPQRMTAVINAFCVNYPEVGTQNIDKLEEITKAIISVLEAYVKTNGIYFQYSIVSQNVMNDYDQKNMSYVSIRLNCYIENNN